jgi:hypothetical protein
VRSAELGLAARHALANVTLQLDGVLLLMLAQAGHAGSGAASFTALYYVLRPLLAASTHWVRTFYFDLKLIETGALRAFRPQLLRFLERLAVTWAGVLAVITLGLAGVLFGEHAGDRPRGLDRDAGSGASRHRSSRCRYTRARGDGRVRTPLGSLANGGDASRSARLPRMARLVARQRELPTGSFAGRCAIGSGRCDRPRVAPLVSSWRDCALGAPRRVARSCGD